jgi:hypothetical protein
MARKNIFDDFIFFISFYFGELTLRQDGVVKRKSKKQADWNALG